MTRTAPGTEGAETVIGAIVWIGGLLAFAAGALLLYQHVIVQLHRAVGL